MHVALPPSDHRFSLLDALRGFAVLGIFGVNIMASSLFFFTDDAAKQWTAGAADHWFEIAINTLVEGKFYSIFSLLFGIGFGLQLQKHTDAGQDGLPLFKRRLWGLLLIGLLHLLCLWMGDILFLYAWLGFVMIAFRHKSNTWLLKAALVCLAMPLLLYPLRMLHENAHLGLPLYGLLVLILKAAGLELGSMNPVVMQTSPGWANYFQTNMFTTLYRQADLFDQVRPFKVIAMFFVGMWVSRHRWYQTPQVFLNRFRTWWPWVLVPALLINLGMAAIPGDQYYAGSGMGLLKTLLYMLGVVPLALCYVYLFTSAYLSGRCGWLHAFSWVGRMALTNYLLQSILYVVLFRWPFFALAGKVSPLYAIIPVLVFFPLQVVGSRWWLRRFQYGPFEWLWRSMTYGRWQPMQRKKQQPAGS